MTVLKGRALAVIISVLLLSFTSCKPDVITKEERIYSFIGAVNTSNYYSALLMFRNPVLVDVSDFIAEYFPPPGDISNPMTIISYNTPDPNYSNIVQLGIVMADAPAVTIYYTFTLSSEYLTPPLYGEHWFIDSITVEPHVYHIPTP